ncbi:hypothetical protein BGZ97_009592, partial [Linnemannia gamsii]
MRHTEFDPSPLLDTVVSYTGGSIVDPAADQLLGDQVDTPIQAHDHGTATADTYVESDQDTTLVDDPITIHSTG